MARGSQDYIAHALETADGLEGWLWSGPRHRRRRIAGGSRASGKTGRQRPSTATCRCSARRSNRATRAMRSRANVRSRTFLRFRNCPNRSANRPVPDDVLVRRHEQLARARRRSLWKVRCSSGCDAAKFFTLTVGQVDFSARGIRLEAKNVKNRTDAFLPASSHAMQFMAQLVDQAHDRRTQFASSPGADLRPVKGSSPRRSGCRSNYTQIRMDATLQWTHSRSRKSTAAPLALEKRRWSCHHNAGRDDKQARCRSEARAPFRLRNDAGDEVADEVTRAAARSAQRIDASLKMVR